MRIFVNYVASPGRATPLNLAVARIIVGLYAAWKVATYPFAGIRDFPHFLLLANPLAPQNAFFARASGTLAWIPAAQLAIVLCLIVFASGRWTRLAAGGGALLLAGLSGLNYLIVNERTFLLTVYFLIFYGLYCSADRGRLEVRSCRSGASTRDAAPRYPLSALRLFQIVFAAIYFFTGVAKIKGGGMSLAWADAANVRLVLQHNAVYHLHEMPRVAAAILPHDAILGGIGIATLALELGFLPALLLRAPIGPFALGLVGMHLGILATMHLNYLTDMAVFFALFVAWDDLAVRFREWRSPDAPASAPRAHLDTLRVEHDEALPSG